MSEKKRRKRRQPQRRSARLLAEARKVCESKQLNPSAAFIIRDRQLASERAEKLMAEL